MIALALIVAQAAAFSTPPAEYPEFDTATARTILAVVEVRETGDLPGFEVCGGPGVWCLHSPSWFRADVRSVVHGEALPAQVYAATTSHYGPVAAPEEFGKPMLMLLRSDGESLVMVRYASAMLVADSAGVLHLPVEDMAPLWWLPCAATGTWTPITDPTLVAEMSLPAKGATLPPGLSLGSSAWRTRGRLSTPRWSIPIPRLQRFLADADDLPSHLKCLRGDDVAADGVLGASRLTDAGPRLREAMARPPTAVPELPATGTESAHAVIAVEARGPLPRQACPDTVATCVESAPVWFRGRKLHTVSGLVLDDTFHAASLGPADLPLAPEASEQPLLVKLRAGDAGAVLVPGAVAALRADSRGSLHLPVDDGVPAWLPCALEADVVPTDDPALAAASIRRAIPLARIKLRVQGAWSDARPCAAASD